MKIVSSPPPPEKRYFDHPITVELTQQEAFLLGAISGLVSGLGPARQMISNFGQVIEEHYGIDRMRDYYDLYGRIQPRGEIHFIATEGWQEALP